MLQPLSHLMAGQLNVLKPLTGNEGAAHSLYSALFQGAVNMLRISCMNLCPPTFPPPPSPPSSSSLLLCIDVPLIAAVAESKRAS